MIYASENTVGKILKDIIQLNKTSNINKNCLKFSTC